MSKLNNNQIIDGVKIFPLSQIIDERGKVMHMLKKTDDHFVGFGEIYFSTCWPGAIKAWHQHTKMTVNNCIVSGRAKLVIYDPRKDSKTFGNIMEIFLGEDNYKLVQISPGLINGYKSYGDKLTILANCADMPHDPNEMIKIDPFENDIPYNWELKHS